MIFLIMKWLKLHPSCSQFINSRDILARFTKKWEKLWDRNVVFSNLNETKLFLDNRKALLITQDIFQIKQGTKFKKLIQPIIILLEVQCCNHLF